MSRAEDDAGRELRLRTLALRYRGPLVRYFRRRGVPPDAVEDCAQDVFVRIARADSGLIENAEAYLFSIAANVIIDRARRARARREDGHGPIDDYAVLGVEHSPARVFEGREAIVRLSAILSELPPRTREIFLLNRLEGLTYTQLAARYAMSVKAIEKQMSKALVHLRRRFPPDERI